MLKKKSNSRIHLNLRGNLKKSLLGDLKIKGGAGTPKKFLYLVYRITEMLHILALFSQQQRLLKISHMQSYYHRHNKDSSTQVT